MSVKVGDKIKDVMDTTRWLDPPEQGAYERFFIMDTETHEWFRGFSRESLAKFVLGTLECLPTRYHPFIHQIHHLIVYNDGKSFSYDAHEYEDGSWQ